MNILTQLELLEQESKQFDNHTLKQKKDEFLEWLEVHIHENHEYRILDTKCIVDLGFLDEMDRYLLKRDHPEWYPLSVYSGEDLLNYYKESLQNALDGFVIEEYDRTYIFH